MPFPSELMVHTLTVYPSVETRDSQGGSVVAYSSTPRVSGEPCLATVQGGNERERFSQLSQTEDVTVATLYLGTQTADMIEVFDETGSSLGQYHVTSILTQPGVSAWVDIESWCRIGAERIQTGT